MILERLIQNYYEWNGDFLGIEKTSIANSIYVAASEKGVSLTEYCYEALGYQPVGIYKASEVAKIRGGILFQNSEILKAYFNTDNLSIIKNKLKETAIPFNRSIKKPLKINPAYSMEVNLLKVYFKESPDCFLAYKGQYHQFGTIINLEYPNYKQVLKDNKKQSILDIVKDIAPPIHFSYRKGCILAISDGVFYLDRRLKIDTKNYILDTALKLLYQYRDLIPHSWYGSIPNLPLLSYKNKEGYLSLLDFTRGADLTYSELLNEFGIIVPNQIVAYEQAGVPFIVCDEEVFFSNDNNDSKQPYYNVTLEEFVSLPREALQRFGDVSKERYNLNSTNTLTKIGGFDL